MHRPDSPLALRTIITAAIGAAAVALLAFRGGADAAVDGGVTRAQPDAFAGTLTKPITSYTAAELSKSFGAKFTGARVSKARRCSGPPSCQTNRAFALQADAILDAHRVDVTTLATDAPNGVIVARLTGSGAGSEARYGIAAGTYYVIVFPGQQSGAAVYRIVNASTGQFVGPSGPFTPCNHPPRSAPAVAFQTCQSASSGGAGGMASRLLNAIFREKHGPSASSSVDAFAAQFDDDPPLWLSCAQGCCTAGL